MLIKRKIMNKLKNKVARRKFFDNGELELAQGNAL
jgi:hypothetical protein